MRLAELLMLVVAIIAVVFAWPTFADWQCRDFQRFCPTNLPPDPSPEVAAWETAEAIGTPEAYRVFLQRYPDGQYADAARDMIALLEVDYPPIQAAAGRIRCYPDGGPCFNEFAERVPRPSGPPASPDGDTRLCPIILEHRAATGRIACSDSRGVCVNDRGWMVTRDGAPINGPCD